jgi:cytochrome c-type biogenesis protein
LILRVPDPQAGDIRNEIARCHANDSITSDHVPAKGKRDACFVRGAVASRRMTPDVTIFAAALAGLVSFLSPCVLPLVPPYLVYLAGTSLEQMVDSERKTARRGAVTAALLFVLGFSTVFVALGASASAVGSLMREWSYVLGKIAGMAIIIMGLHFLGVTPISWLQRQKRLELAKPVGLWGAYAMGLAFAFGWTPCIGPILAAILAVATSEQTVTKGAGLLAVYSLGLGVPFVLAALAIEPFAAFLTHFKRYLHRVEQVMGVLLVLTGIAFLWPSLNWINSFSVWLLETFPILSEIG